MHTCRMREPPSPTFRIMPTSTDPFGRHCLYAGGDQFLTFFKFAQASLLPSEAHDG